MTAVPKPVAEGWWNASTDGFHQLCSPRISCEPAVVLLKTEYDRMVEALALALEITQLTKQLIELVNHD